MHVQGVQNFRFSWLNMQICDVFSCRLHPDCLHSLFAQWWLFCDYCCLFTFYTLLTNYAKNRPVGAPKNLIQRMKDLLLGVHAVVETISFWKFDIAVWQTTSKNAKVSKYLPHVQHYYFSLFNQSDHVVFTVAFVLALKAICLIINPSLLLCLRRLPTVDLNLKTGKWSFRDRKT